MMDDLAAYLGTVVFEEDKKHKLGNIRLEMLGLVQEADVTPHYTIFKGVTSDKEKLAKRIEILKTKLETTKDLASDPDKTLERLSLLNGKVFTISVPSTSDIEDKERMDRVDDAINACKGALEDGYVPGGGVTLARIGAQKTPFISKVLAAPMNKILSNAGAHGIDYKLDLSKPTHSYDLRNKESGPALEIGVIDPYKVTEAAVINGLSVGSMLLTTKAIVLPKQVKESPFQMDY
jgi:chaperonin GroEL